MKPLQTFTFSIALTLPLIAASQPTASWFDHTVEARGQFQDINVNGRNGGTGRDGYDGRNGMDGRNAYCPDPKRAENGGDGEDGQDGEGGHSGEDGQPGGDVLVYFDNPVQLKNIFIHSIGGNGGRGGEGGRGGMGGRGGWGCNGGWNGRDGRNGWDGRQGGYGSKGRDGTLYLKQGYELLQPSAPSISVTLKQLFSTTSQIRKNIWQDKPGAAALLAPGSALANAYYEFQRTVVLSMRGILTGGQNLTEEILNQQIEFTFNDALTEPVINFTDSRMVVFLSRENQGTEFIYKIDSIYNSDDFFDFRAGIRGEIGTDRRILLSDRRRSWDDLPTTLKVRMESGSREFSVPAGAVRKSPYGPEIMIGKVPGLKQYEGTSGSFSVIMSRNLKGRILVRSFTLKDGL